LNERGAKATGGDAFPTKEQLDATDVLIIHRDGGGDFKPEEKVLVEEFTKRGGGIVVIHAGTVANTPEGTDYYKQLIGGSWRKGQTKWLEGKMSLYFTDHENQITKDCSNFDMTDEIYYDMDLAPEIKVLAAAYTPNPMGRDEKAMKRAAEMTHGGKVVSVYDVQPQVWTYEKENYRAFVSIPGHEYENFSRPNFRALLLRGIAWAGKRANTDEFCKPDELGDNLRYVEGGPTRPEKAAEKLEVHPDFNISLVASEPLVNKVMNVDWDEKGRMWVCETPEYPNGRRLPKTDAWKESGSVIKENIADREPSDRISWLEDTNGDGVMDKKHVFADKLELVTSFVFYKNGVIATSAPDIWFLEDTTGKGVCDKRTKLYTGLGDRDTHAVMNNARWGLDGWIYATNGYSTSGKVTNGDGSKDFGGYTAGVVRFKPDGSAFEQYSSKNSNTWGLTMTWDGQCFFTQPTCGDVLMHVVLPESVLAKGKLPGTNSFNVLMKGESTFPLMKWEQQAYVQIDQVGKFTAAAGCAIYEGGAWPAKWNYSYFTTEPTINIVSHRFVTPDGVTYKSEKEKGREETEFIRSKDLWFRPIENRVGPDGALYIVDFYNQAVIHNDTRGPQHGPANAAVRPDRDHYFSRIWRVQHKEAKKLEVPKMDLNVVNLYGIMGSHPNAHVKQTALRLLREGGKDLPMIPPGTGGAGSIFEHDLSKPFNETKLMRDLGFWKNELSSPKNDSHIAAMLSFPYDNWTRSGLVSMATDYPVRIIEAALKREKFWWNRNEYITPFIALLPAAFKTDAAANATKLLTACATAPSSADGLKNVILKGIADQSDLKVTVDATLVESLKKLLANPATAGAALPIVAKWDTTGALKEAVSAQANALLTQLANTKLSADQRAQAAAGLLAVRSMNPAVLPALAKVLTDDNADELKERVLGTLGEASDNDSGKVVITAYSGLKPALQSAAFDQLIKRPEWTRALLNAVKDGSIKAADLGPANVARLRTHPSKPIAQLANKMLDQLISPASKEKNKLLAALTPEVEKPGGSAEKGKAIFTAACSICHKLGTLGKEVGPILDGMGAHAPADLLIAVIDPNREVDPSFHAWNIVKKNGEVLAGVIAQENTASVQLRNQAGAFEIPKDQIATRENTHRSLMPEGFEALGAENLRDLMAFLNASETRFRILNLTDAYTADTRRGLFGSESNTKDTIYTKKFGTVTAEGVPFTLMDPLKSVSGSSVIVLKGGPDAKDFSKTFPQRVEVPVNIEARKLHLLGGVGGWAWPFGGAENKDKPVMKVIATYADGQTEDFVLKNGVEFVDYVGTAEVPGSKLAKDLVTRGQLRIITLELKKKGAITKLTLESTDSVVAPVIVAITAEK
jgi:putative membrane-bound dehydrogenase-like protein